MIHLHRKHSLHQLLLSLTPHKATIASFFNPFSTSTLATQTQALKPHFMVEYLITSCGLSANNAIQASQHLSHVKSPSNADSVLLYLRNSGLEDTHIKDLIYKHPKFLCSSVYKTIKPKIDTLQDMGFSFAEAAEVTSETLRVIDSSDIRPKIEFWRKLLGSNENLLKAFRRNNYLLSCRLEDRIMPNINFLQNCGITDDRIAKLILTAPMFVTRSSEWMKSIVKRVEDLGVPRHSGLFLHLLQSVMAISSATVEAKFNFLRGLGWSEEEIRMAIRKAPVLLRLSKEKIQRSVEFLVDVAGCETSYVPQHPNLMLFSLEGRLVPRYSVVQILESKGLLKKKLRLTSLMTLTDEKFIEKFISLHIKEVPELFDSYVAATAGKTPAYCLS